MYYGLSLNVGNFGLDIYLTQFVFGAVEIPARVGSLPLLQRFGRRICQAGVLFFGGAACLGILAIPTGNLLHYDEVFFQSIRNFILCLKIVHVCFFLSDYTYCTFNLFVFIICPLDLPVVITVIAVLGKFAATASFSTVYVYTAELYPTVLR